MTRRLADRPGTALERLIRASSDHVGGCRRCQAWYRLAEAGEEIHPAIGGPTGPRCPAAKAIDAGILEARRFEERYGIPKP